LEDSVKRLLAIFLAFLLFTLGSCGTEPPDEPQISEETSETSNGGAEPAIAIYPKAQNLTVKNKQLKLEKVSVTSDDTTDQNALNALTALLKSNNVEISDGSDVKIYLGANHSVSPEGEGYYINTEGPDIVLASKGAAGQFYAVQTLKYLLNGNALEAAEIEDAPDFPIRGVVEGFYGTPWSHENRLSMIAFLGRYKMNTYMFAPKDDPKHRERWRELYNDEEKEKLRELVNACKVNSVNFVYAIAPGLDMDFGSGYQSDKARLIEKCDSLYELGVRHFAILLDDLPERTAQTAEYHARLVNDFRNEFYVKHADLAELICIFAEYYDTVVTEEYTNTVAASLNDKVYVMWTGSSLALKMSVSDFEKSNAIYGRKMLLWWNYPVNDYVEGCLFTDGVKNLHSNLKNAVSGFLSNPMNQAEASKIPLFTLADYLWNPSKYVYKDSFKAALTTLHPNTYESVQKICENSYANNLNGETDSVVFYNYVNAYINEASNGKFDGSAANKLYAEFEKLKNAVADIKENDKNTAFVAEITPWLDKADLTASMGMNLMKALQADDEETFWKHCALFYADKEKYDANTAGFSRYVLTPFLTEKATDWLASGGEKLLSKNKQNIEISVTKSKAVASSSLGWYQDYDIRYATDDDDKTYYWSAGAATEGYWIMLDLGKVEKVRNIVLKSGCDSYGADYLRKGQMQYSLDGVEWFDVGGVQTAKVVALSGLDIECRYVRYLSVSKQDYWMTVSDFAVNVDVTCKEVSGGPYGEYTCEAYRMLDNDLTTFYRSERAPAAGETLTIHSIPKDAAKMTVLQSSLCGADVILIAGGKETKLGTLDQYYNTFNLPADGSADAVVFKWHGDTIPYINEVTFR